MLDKATHFADRVVRPISGWIHSVGVSVLAVMMFLTFADVFLRYVFNRPILASHELTLYMMAILVAFGLAYCAVLKGHVAIDLVVSHFPPRTQAIIDSVTCIISLGLFSLITWQGAIYTMDKLVSGHESEVLEIPIYPFIGVVTLGSLVLCLVLISHLFEFLSQAVRK